MKKYEYHVLAMDILEVWNDDDEIRKQRLDTLNDFGKDSWEIVACTSGEMASIVFKREIEG
jgi:hypothetical protein